MAIGGNNPIKYSDIFDTTDNQALNDIINGLGLVDKEFNKLVTSFQQGSKTMRDSFVAAADDIAEALKKITISQNAQREALLQLAQATDELKNREKTWTDTKKKEEKVIDEAADSVNGLKRRIKELTDEYNKLSKSEAAEKARMDEIVKETQALKKEQKDLVDAMKLTRTNTEYVVGSYKALEEETRRLMKELKEMPNAFDKSNAAGQDLIKRIRENNEALKQYDAQLGIHNRSVGDYKKALEGTGEELKAFGLSIAAAYLGFQSFQDFIQKVIDDNMKVADSLANVQRTASLTSKEANNLVDALKDIDTRTTLVGLLDLAKIGAQLGFETTKDLEGFTKAIDQLSVSLSDEITGGAEAIASAIGKINGVFRTQANEGTDVEQSMLKTGSAILKLGQVGLATGEYLVDFTQRVSAVSSQVGIALPVMLAYSSTLEESGISAEVAGTAVSQLITRLARAPEAFYAVAKAASPDLTLKDFVDFINNDTQQALTLFFAGLNKAGGTTTEFNKILDGLDFRGQRVNSVVTALAQRQELLALRTKQASEAYEDGTLATDQFAIKNENLAAAFEKVFNAVTNTFVNSEGAQGLAKIINGMVTGQTEADKLTDSFKLQKATLDEVDSTLPPLIKKYDDLKEEAFDLGGVNKLTADDQAELNKVIQQIADILPEAISQVDQYGNAVDITRGKISQLTDAMRENVRNAGISAARETREEIARLNETIRVNQGLITARGGDIGPGAQRAGAFDFGRDFTASNRSPREEIGRNSLKLAENIKQLRDVLLQDLSPAEQAVYDKFYGSTKKVEKSTQELKEETGEADKVLDRMGGTAQKAKSTIEKLSEALEELRNQLESEAVLGEISNDTMGKFIKTYLLLEDAQRKASKAINEAIDPYQSMVDEVQYLNQKLERQIALGDDTTDTIAELADATDRLRAKQNALKIDLAAATSQMEVLNTQVETNRKELEEAIALGNDYSEYLHKLTSASKELERVNRQLNLSILRVTDPMAFLSAQADELKRILAQQAAAGIISEESIKKYKDALDQLAAAQQRFNDAIKYDPNDPYNQIRDATMAELQKQADVYRIEPFAENEDRSAIEKYRRYQNELLTLTIDRITAQQDLYDEETLEWQSLETEKTRVQAEQERLRTDIVKEEAQKRAQIIMEGLNLLSMGLNGFNDLQKQNSENEIARQEKQKEKELQLAGNNAQAQDAINKKYAQKQAELKRKEAEADKTNALFNIALNTAQGATKAISEFPLTGGMPFLAFVLAQGALQAGIVAATPLPEYYKGRYYGGKAEYAKLGEHGPEAVVKKDGTVRITPGKAHIGYLDAGDRVYPAHSAETQFYKTVVEANKDMSYYGATNKAYVSSYSSIANAKQGYDIYTVARAMKISGGGVTPKQIQDAFGAALDNRPYQSVIMDEEGFRKFNYEKNQRIEILNQRNSFGGKG